MSLTFDTQKAVQRLRESGVVEAHADATVAVMAEATGPLVTQDYLDARLGAGDRGTACGIQSRAAGAGTEDWRGSWSGWQELSLAAAALLFD